MKICKGRPPKRETFRQHPHSQGFPLWDRLTVWTDFEPISGHVRPIRKGDGFPRATGSLLLTSTRIKLRSIGEGSNDVTTVKVGKLGKHDGTQGRPSLPSVEKWDVENENTTLPPAADGQQQREVVILKGNRDGGVCGRREGRSICRAWRVGW
jgi:hypothetical protein